MKKYILISLIFSLVSYGYSFDNKEVELFLKSFENSVQSHQKKQVLEFLDEDYKKSQHDEFLNGNTKQFLNELFCGNLKNNSEEFKCAVFDEITVIKHIEFKQEDELIHVFFEVKCNDEIILVDLYLKESIKNGKKELGVLGAVG